MLNYHFLVTVIYPLSVEKPSVSFQLLSKRKNSTVVHLGLLDMSTGLGTNITMGNKQNGQRYRSKEKMKENMNNSNNEINEVPAKELDPEQPQHHHLTISDDTEPQLSCSHTQSLSKEIKEAVTAAIIDGADTSPEFPLKETSNDLSENSDIKSSDQLKKSPLVSSEALNCDDLNAPKSSDAQKKYSIEELRSFKYLVMNGTLNDLKGAGMRDRREWNNVKVQSQKKQVAFAVDETVCGLVIGKGGVNVKKLEKTYDVEIIVNAKKSDVATKRIVTIIGYDAANIEKARLALDYQQVFIPILGLAQKKLVALNSEDKFQRWRADSGVVRIEFEDELENYDPGRHTNGNYPSHSGYKMTTRELIKQKKEESNDLHSGFLRLVGTKEAVSKGQKMIEEELDAIQKVGTNLKEPQEEDIRVYNMETNYSRVAAQTGYNGYRGKPEPYKGSFAENSAIYRLWQQQQQAIPCHGYYNPYNHAQFQPHPYFTQSAFRPNNNTNPNRFKSLGSRRRSLKYSKAQRSLDDMLLEGKLSVDQYAMRMARRGK